MREREVGRSVHGAPIVAHDFGGGDCALLVFGAIHGDEPESAILCTRFISKLRQSDVKERIIMIPVLNPDGLAAQTKDNARGVDLNRNFAARSWAREHKAGYFPGEHPLSEPEAAALAALVERERPRVVVAVHQPFRCVNWDGPAESLAARMSEACGYPAVASVGYPTPGSFGAWWGIDRARTTITLELPRAVEESDYDGCLRALDCAKLFAP